MQMNKKKSIIKRMKKLIGYTISDSDLEYQIFLTKESLEQCKNLIQLILLDVKRQQKNRYIIALAGPPGSGKSSISALLKKLSIEYYGVKIITLPMDGFHHTNEYLKSHYINYKGKKISLYELKGAPESYNIEKYTHFIKRLTLADDNFYWPVYSRIKHEPVEKGILIKPEDKIFIIEGNYLLIGNKKWNNVENLYNKKLFLRPSIILKFKLKKRIIDRKIRGGYSKKEAKKHFRLTDRKNIKIVLKESKNYDILIKQKGLYSYSVRLIKT